MSARLYNVLFLCTGNSARSILAEAVLRKVGAGRFQSYSAGSRPLGRVNPLTIETLADKGHDTDALRSKSWDEFVAPDAPRMDIVVTVCDSAAGETCPLWPGAPVKVHWGFADPSHIVGSEEVKRAAFAATYDAIEKQLRAFVATPLEGLTSAEQQARLQALAGAA